MDHRVGRASAILMIFALAAAGGCGRDPGERAVEPLPAEEPAALAGTEIAPGMTLERLLIQSDFEPNLGAYARADALPRPLPRPDRDGKPPALATLHGAATRLDGEVLVMEGDAGIVSTLGEGQLGLRLDQQRQDPVAIVRRFLGERPDDFDFIVVWTTFSDRGAEGLAYYMGIRNDVRGIGQPKFDNGFFWGTRSGGRLKGFLNMKSIGLYGGSITSPSSYAYPVMGQEMTHRWLAFLLFRREDGTVSNAMLGRDDSHWSTLLEADASVQDGMRWRDNGDGSFTSLGFMEKFSDLDLYAMGLLPPEEVEPWFLIEEAVFNGKKLEGSMQLPVGMRIKGSRTDISMEQVISASGARKPSFQTSPKQFRVAFILVTRPGETADDVAGEVEAVETFRKVWEGRFEAWTGGRAQICTRISASCDRPALQLESAEVVEKEGDGDGMPEPGETVAVNLRVANPGGAVAEEVKAAIVVAADSGIEPIQVGAFVPDIEPGEVVEVEAAFVLGIGSRDLCGTAPALEIRLRAGDLFAKGSVRFPVGFLDLWRDDFDSDRGWTRDPAGTDTATKGVWERAVPTGVDGGHAGIDVQTQPAGGHSGGGPAMVTGAKGGRLGDNDLDDGITTLLSPSIDLSGARDPVLSWYSWRIGLDFNDPGGAIRPEDNDPLVVEISTDDGATWLLVDEDRSNEQRWLLKEVRLLDLLPEIPAAIRVRITARDEDPQSLSEAAIDDLRVWDLQPSCLDPVEEPSEPPPVEEPVTTPPEDPQGPTGNPGVGSTQGSDPSTDPSAGSTGGPSTSSGGCSATPSAALPQTWLLLLLPVAWLTWRRRRSQDAEVRSAP